MLTTPGSPQRARWAVMWIATSGRKRKVIRKDFKDDVASATKLFLKARDANKPYATLACVNMGFPPPKELRPHDVVKRGRSKRTGKIKTVRVTIQPLKDLNHEGKLWCPYCMELRPFIRKNTVVYKGVRMNDPRYVCPICKVSQRDYHVRLWNPTAVMHMDSSLTVIRRRAKTTPTRRRRRR